jgi:porin
MILARTTLGLAALVAWFPALPALADDAAPPDLWHQATLLGDAGGLRPALADYGITLQANEASEVLGNLSGGLKQGATYDGLTTLTLQLDTAKAFGWEGGVFNISGLQIHGRNLSQYYLRNLQTASGIEAAPATRLWEMWYQQTLPGGLDVKAGLQSLDQEFIVSQGSALFLNTMAGWPMLPSADLYAGGPAYPLSSLGVRLRAQPGGGVTVLAGVFADNPPGGPFGADSQLLGPTRWGANFSLRTGALAIAEVQYASDPAAAHAGTYKLGAWYDSGRFPSQSVDTAGISLAAPASNGQPAAREGNASVYAVVDQTLWRPAADGPRALAAFVRAMGAPGDRNLIDFSVNAGLTLKAPFAGRDDDSIGLGCGLAHIGSGARSLDGATDVYAGTTGNIRSSESFFELTYQAQITPWLQLQPDLQYVALPGGGIADPNRPGHRLANELIAGARALVTF